MRYPEHFYVKKTIKTDTYDTTPSETLDVERCLKQEACFVHEKETTRVVQKTIVLHNWRNKLNADLTSHDRKDFIHGLYEAGFTIYDIHPKTRSLIKLDRDAYNAIYDTESPFKLFHLSEAEENLDELYQISTPGQLLAEAAQEQLKISKDEILILDELMVYTQIISDNANEKFILSISDFNIHDSIRALHSLATTNPTLFSRILAVEVLENTMKFQIKAGTFGDKKIRMEQFRMLSELRGNIHQIPLIYSRNHMEKKLSDDFFSRYRMLNQANPRTSFSAVDIEDEGITEDELRNRKHIAIDRIGETIKSSDINYILASCKSAIKLRLNADALESRSDAFVTNKQIQNLGITLHSQAGQHTDLAPLIKALPNLRSLSIWSEYSKSSGLPPHQGIKSLSLNVNSSNLIAALKEAATLKNLTNLKLNVTYTDKIVGEALLKSPKLAKLEQLVIENLILKSTSDLARLLSLMPNLKTLHLYNGIIRHSDSDKNMSDTRIPQIKHLRLTKTDIASVYRINNTLKGCNFESYELGVCDLINDESDDIEKLSPVKLSTKLLSLSNCELDNISLSKLLWQCDDALTSLYMHLVDYENCHQEEQLTLPDLNISSIILRSSKSTEILSLPLKVAASSPIKYFGGFVYHPNSSLHLPKQRIKVGSTNYEGFAFNQEFYSCCETLTIEVNIDDCFTNHSKPSAKEDDFTINPGIKHLQIFIERQDVLNQEIKMIHKLLPSFPNLQALSIFHNDSEGDRNELPLKIFKKLKPLSYPNLKILRLNNERSESPSPSEFLSFAPNLKLITYSDLTVCESSLPFTVDIRNPLSRDELPAQALSTSQAKLRRLLINGLVRTHKAPEHRLEEYSNDHPCTITETGLILSPSMSQTIIIDKVVRYLKMTGNKRDIPINGLTLGICNSLAHFYQELTDEDWRHIVEIISTFNGNETLAIDTPTITVFERLLDKIEEHNLSTSLRYKPETHYFIGGNIGSVLSSLNKNQSHIIVNLDHAITVRRIHQDLYHLYDPNADSGYPAKLTLIETIHSITRNNLGQLIGTTDPTPINKNSFSLWSSLDEFIRKGGLMAICHFTNLRQCFIPYPHLSASLRAETYLEGLKHGGSSLVPPVLCSMLKRPALHPMLIHALDLLFSDASEKVAAKRMAAVLKNLRGQSIAQLEMVRNAFDIVFCTLLSPIIIDAFHDVFDPIYKIASDREVAKNNLLDNMQNDLAENNKQPEETLDLRAQQIDNDNKFEDSPYKQKFEISKAILFTQESKSLRYAISVLAEYHRKRQPVIYLSDSDELDFESPTLHRTEENQGILDEHAKPLMRFITEHKGNRDALIIINCEKMDASRLKAYKKIFSVKFGILVLALITENNPHLPSLKESIPLFKYARPLTATEAQQIKACPYISIPHCDNVTENHLIIDLFHDKHWKTLLLGHWRIEGKHIVYREGALAPAIETGRPIIIANAPWDDAGFIMFWQQALLTRQIDNAGCTITLPDSLVLQSMESYAYLPWCEIVEAEMGLSESAHLLNRTTLPSFYDNHHIQPETGELQSEPGLIEQYNGKTLVVNMTDTLSEHELARLVSTCQQHGVKLKLFTLSHEFVSPFITVKASDWQGINPSGIKIYVSNDTDALTEQLVAESDKRPLVFSVNGRQPNDLLGYIQAEKQAEKSSLFNYTFKRSAGAVFDALHANTPVILKGEFTPSLAQALASLLLEPNSPYKDLLTIVSESSEHFHYIKTEPVELSIDQKINLLESRFKTQISAEQSAGWQDETFTELRAKWLYSMLHNTAAISNEPWQGLRSLDVQLPMAPLDQASAVTQANSFDDERVNAVMSILSHSPFVFLAGITGVGKTLFVQKVLTSAVDARVYYEKDGIIHWANDHSDESFKILFLDEFNIGDNQGHEFEDCFNHPPSILSPITRERLVLTDKHKIIFAGNPINYAHNRHLPELIRRHGCSTIFNPITPAYLYVNILSPLFTGHARLASHSFDICNKILEVYGYACKISRDEVIITPRELSMMAMLTIAHFEKNPNCDITQAAAYYAYTLAKPHMPSDHLSQFESRFKICNPSNQEDTPAASNHNAAQLIHDLLVLRALRISNRDHWSQDRLYAGLGGIVLQGEVSSQKSKLLRSLIQPNQNLAIDHDDLIYIDSKMKTAKAKSALIQAFEAGKIVILKDIAQSPTLEHCLNSLLMGKHPDTQTRPAKPGFLVLATHTLTHGLYQAHLSAALSRRLISISMADASVPLKPKSSRSVDQMADFTQHEPKRQRRCES